MNRHLPLALAGCCLLATAAEDAPLGSADYYPSPERPIGWRGDGNGAYPGATPVADFFSGPPEEVEVRVLQTWNEPETKKRWDVGEGPSKNMVWNTKLPSWGHAQPIIVGDRAITVESDGPDAVRKCVDHAARGGYQGIFPERFRKSETPVRGGPRVPARTTAEDRERRRRRIRRNV